MTDDNVFILILIMLFLLLDQWLIFISESRIERVVLSMLGIVMTIAGMVLLFLP